MAARREKLGREFSFAQRCYAFLADDAIEVDEVDGYDVTRRRVLLDDVLLVTLHRARRTGLLVFALGTVAFLTWPMLLIPKGNDAGIVFAILDAPFVLLFLGHLALGTDYLTVFGRRSRARMAFNLRKGRAREVFQQLTARVAEHQARLAPAPAAAPPQGERPASMSPEPAPAA